MRLSNRTAHRDCPLCRFLRPGHLPARYVVVHRFTHSIAMLHPKQYYPGHCELWLKTHAQELFQLSHNIRNEFLDEMTTLAQAVHDELTPRKINYELLGNVAPHLHWHITPRQHDDPHPRSTIWANPQYTAPSRKTFMPRADKLALAQRLRAQIKRIQRD